MQTNDTYCKDCIFAIWEDITQTGCSRGQLDKYRKVGATVLDCYDEEREFNVIQGRICLYKRTEKWLDESTQDIEERLKIETTLRYQSIIISNNNLDDILLTLKSLDKQTLKPSLVTIVLNTKDTIPPRQVMKNISEFNLKIKVEKLILDKTIEEIAQHVFRNSRCSYYALIPSGYKLDTDFYEVINSLVVDKLVQFGTITTDDDKVIVFPGSVHSYWYFHGDPTKSMLDNVKEWECQNKQKIYYKMNEVKKMLLAS